MCQQPASSEPRILLEAIRKLDDLARDFRRRLRDCAVQLSQASGSGVLIRPETISEALPIACREMLSAAGHNPENQRGSDDRRPEAA